MSDLPPFPKPSAFNLPRDYEMARAEAYKARLEVAMEALRFLVINLEPGSDRFLVAKSLEKIGELPKVAKSL